MAEEETTETTETETETETTPPETETSTETSTEESTTESAKTYDESYVKKLRGEAATHRTKLRETEERMAKLEKKLAEEEKKKLSDSERTQVELQETKDELAKLQADLDQRSQLSREVQLEADVVKIAVLPDLGIVDPDAAYKLLDRDALEFDDETGRATNIREVLDALVEERPYLVATGEKKPPKVGATNSERQKGKALTREDIARMTPDEVNELWESGQIPDALRSGVLQ
jgi:myosin heavy subunit